MKNLPSSKVIQIIAFFLSFGLLTNISANWVHKNISDAVFAEDVIERKPINIISDGEIYSKNKIYFWTNIRNLSGDKITHRWIYNDKIFAEVSFEIKGKRWRVWSSKRFLRSWGGVWEVQVLNRNSEILLSKKFTFRGGGNYE